MQRQSHISKMFGTIARKHKAKIASYSFERKQVISSHKNYCYLCAISQTQYEVKKIVHFICSKNMPTSSLQRRKTKKKKKNDSSGFLGQFDSSINFFLQLWQPSYFFKFLHKDLNQTIESNNLKRITNKNNSLPQVRGRAHMERR